MTCCLVVIVAVHLVVQPPYLFGENGKSECHMELKTENYQDQTKFNKEYLIGMSFTLVYLTSGTYASKTAAYLKLNDSNNVSNQ